MAYVGCIAGAIPIEDYRRQLHEAGFAAVEVIDTGSDLNAYAKVGVETGVSSASPHQLVVMLFDGAMKALGAAIVNMKANNIAAVELMVIDVDTSSSRMPSNRTSMSFNEQMATPTRPTSPKASGWSASMPICVGRSKATLRPVMPCSSR